MLSTLSRDKDETGPLTLDEFHAFFKEIEDQPRWRAKADKEMDYVDGNQLSSEILQKQREIGMPPAIEPLIGPAIDAVLGLEAKNRADWRVEPNNESTGDELAKAYGFKLNQAERKSKADRACSDAYRSQVAVGIGWVEVSRDPNPFKYPYRCLAVGRNEIWWDMLAAEQDLSDARYIIRRRWTAVTQVKLMFPDKKEVIGNAASNWLSYEQMDSADGGASTDLAMEYENARSWSIEEQQWRDAAGKRLCLFEVWYRRWVRILVIKTSDGRVVELDKKNPVHMEAIAAELVEPEWAVVPRMRVSIWAGPHCLKDEPSPYKHQKFPYVPFWGKKEDRTGIPYGLVRGMMFMQDNVNATMSKLRWGLAAVRVERTHGAVVMSDSQFREEVARADADIVLDANAMAKGGIFRVERDFQLSDQQWNLLNDGRAGILRVGGISPNLQQQGTGTARSGVQESQQTEQATQALGDINDNFNYSRAEVGELLLSLIVQDDIGKPQEVMVSGESIRDDQVVLLNQKKVDETTGLEYLDNDVERAMLKVAINDVPSTSSYRAQQLSAMSEAFKSMPPEFQRVAMPYLVALMDLPSDSRADIIKAVREAAQMPTPEQIEKQIAEAVKTARTADSRDLKLAELAAKTNPEMLKAELNKMIAETFKINTDAFYATMQAAATAAQMPQLAPVADGIAQLAGYTPPNPGGVDPNIPTVDQSMVAPQGMPAGAPMDGLPTNTSPMLPAPVPSAPTPTSGEAGPGEGIETQRFTDNVPA